MSRFLNYGFFSTANGFAGAYPCSKNERFSRHELGDVSDRNHRLMKAEVLRELGDFESAKHIS